MRSTVIGRPFHRGRTSYWWVAIGLAVVLGSAPVVAQTQRAKHSKPTGAFLGGAVIHTTPVPLVEMIKEADRIFSGTVNSVRMVSEGNRRLLEIGITVERSIKGDTTAVTIYQHPAISSPLAKDDKVLLFLAKRGTENFTLPVGLHSGHFVLSAGDLSHGTFTNLHGNKGLWTESLWERVPEQKVLTLLESKFKDSQKVQKVMSPGNDPPGRALSIELIDTVYKVLQPQMALSIK